MLTRNTTPRPILAGLGLAFALAACSGAGAAAKPEEGNAFLTVVGERTVALDYAQAMNLAVRYHNSDDEPLAGEVKIEVTGDTAGAQIARTSAIADAQGIATFAIKG